MTHSDAERILRERVAAGGRLVLVTRSDLRTIKLLRERCHAANVPTMLGPTSGPG